jgi:hypothetical protein
MEHRERLLRAKIQMIGEPTRISRIQLHPDLDQRRKTGLDGTLHNPEAIWLSWG